MRSTLRRVFCNVRAYVSCRRYDGISLRARVKREIKVAPRILNVFVLDRKSMFLSGAFFYSPEQKCWRMKEEHHAKQNTKTMATLNRPL